ncbi:MAG: type I-U CRISPR-associated protein Csb2 [Actinomycetes bacterium]
MEEDPRVKHLILTCVLTENHFHGIRMGRAGEEECDWPPSPGRVFQSLINAAFAGVPAALHGTMHPAERALEWLERQAPPVVAARDALPEYRRKRLQTALPLNNKKDSDLVKSGLQLAPLRRISGYDLNGRDARVLEIRYLWQLQHDTVPPLDTLDELASRVSYFGRAEDRVEMEFRVVESLPDIPVEHSRWLPSVRNSALRLGVPCPNSLKELRDRHDLLIPARTRKPNALSCLSLQAYQLHDEVGFPQPVLECIVNLVSYDADPDGVVQSFDPSGPDYMLWHETGQTLVDSAYLAQAFLRAPATLWEPLDATAKQRVIAEFKALRRVVPPNNNWVLFMAMVEVFLHWLDEGADQYRISTALNTIESWYVGDGWYSDGPQLHVDYYNSFVIHPMLVDVLDTQRVVAERKKQSTKAIQERYDRALKRMRRYAEFLERMISPEGTYPAFGRSITYRTAIFQALGHCAVLHQLPDEITPGQVRAGLTAVIRRMFAAPGVFDAQGWLTLGFAGHQPNIADYYSNAGSMYICSLGFNALGLPADDAFWTAPAADWTAKKAWAGQPFKKDYAVDY